LLVPINIIGEVASDEIDVSSYTDVYAPPRDIGPREEALMAWAALLGDDDMDDDDGE